MLSQELLEVLDSCRTEIMVSKNRLLNQAFQNDSYELLAIAQDLDFVVLKLCTEIRNEDKKRIHSQERNKENTNKA